MHSLGGSVFITNDQTPPHALSASSASANSHHFTSSGKSILDALFTSKKTKRPAFAILTRDSVTSVVHIDERRHVRDVAEIRWEASGMRNHAVTIRGRSMSSAEFLVRSKALLGLTSWQFSIGDMACKLKQSEHALLGGQTGHRVWEFCDSSSSTLLATFSPPQRGMLKAELVTYGAGKFIIDAIVLAALLVAADKSEWRNTNSVYNRETLERALHTDSVASLPSYSQRPTSSGGRRLPHDQSIPLSASAISITSIEPPPYSSRVDVSSVL